VTAHPSIGAWLGRREGRFDLTFHAIGERTRIGRQFVSYPYHLTRPFALDADIPVLTTVYQQSASGGLYRGDVLSSEIILGRSAAVHITTQAATIVHDCRGRSVRQTTALVLGADAFLALTPDPCVFFPGAALHAETTVRLSPGATLLFSDAFARHDPSGAAQPFDRYVADTRLFSDDGQRLLVRDRMDVAGSDLLAGGSPLGDWQIAASYFLAGPQSRLPGRDALVAAVQTSDAIGGVSSLPNGAGWALRVLARTAVANKWVAEKVFALAVHAALGAVPAARRK
jgi:urease accessory protein